ncbi:MAG: uracil-DNA glycosylase family protein [Bacteroidota bacterium]
MTDINHLREEINTCTICTEHLPLGPRPIFRIHPEAKIVIISQAPGRYAHQSGIPWDDPSGDRLRKWLKTDKDTFYNAKNFAIVPMGFCYPGKGKSGDLPPRKECAPQWHATILKMMPKLELTLLAGQYAQKAYLGSRRKKNLTTTVFDFESYGPAIIPLPHPSPLNARWRKKNPWFEDRVLPILQERVHQLLV